MKSADLLDRLTKLAAAGLFATVGLGVAPALAAVCPSLVTLDRTFEVNPSPACYAYGQGNINGETSGQGADPILTGVTSGNGNNTIVYESAPIANLLLLDKSDAGGILDGVLTGVLGGASTGTITVGSTSGYANLILALKSGANANPVWAAFLIAGPGDYVFTIDPAQNLSHANLYGTLSVVIDPRAIPLPAAAWLMFAGLGGLGLVSRRKTKVA